LVFTGARATGPTQQPPRPTWRARLAAARRKNTKRLTAAQSWVRSTQTFARLMERIGIEPMTSGL
jgi:hypothetical protein